MTAVHDAGLIVLKQKRLPDGVAQKMKGDTMENAGVPYKSGKGVIIGSEYLRQAEDRWIIGTPTMPPGLEVLVVSEEKYRFTPDLFKGASRAQRTRKEDSTTITHLKTGADIVSDSTFAKSSITSTSEGKRMISAYIPQNAHKLSGKRDIQIIFDSELNLRGCYCLDKKGCEWNMYTIPITYILDRNGLQEVEKLKMVHQAKGKCAQIDWLFAIVKTMDPGEAILAVVILVDIDSVVLHLFVLSLKWQRLENGGFRNPVYVQLKKMGHCDLYSITGSAAKYVS